ncbi:hypothetical protein C3L33_16747, partial [Rhododendron williamsianum]
MAGEEQRHVRDLPPDAAPGHRLRDPHNLPGGLHRRVLPRGVGALVLPVRHAAPHRGAAGTDHVRVRGDGRGRRGRGGREGVQGVPAGEVLGVAEELGGEELGDD